jgi:hypothetical protein
LIQLLRHPFATVGCFGRVTVRELRSLGFEKVMVVFEQPPAT